MDRPVENEELELLRDTLRRLVDEEVAPRAEQADRDGRIASWDALVELGLTGIALDDEHGGAGMGEQALFHALEELARGCGSTALVLYAHAAVVEAALVRAGTPEQIARFAPALASGELRGGAVIVEPPARLGDAAGIVARPVQGGLSLSGEAPHGIGGREADVLLVAARDDAAAGERSLFLLERSQPGLEACRSAESPAPLGMRAADLCGIRLRDAAVEDTARLGAPGAADDILAAVRRVSLVAAAFIGVGLSRAALDRSARYARERETFGKPIADHEAVAFKLADMATRAECARRLAAGVARTEADLAERAMARRYAVEAAIKNGYDAIQVHGGYGYSVEYTVERIWRDARTLAELDGSADEDRWAISRALGA